MTYFLNFRVKNTGGAVIEPYLLEGNGAVPSLKVVRWEEVPAIMTGRNVLFATHGFNVSYTRGARALGALDEYLALTPPNLFVGMLWPGDSWLPVVSYPFEGADVLACGRLLAGFCNRWCKGAQTLSFLSHSLGARLVLEAVTRLEREAESVCLAAAAINRDCLTAEYQRAARNARQISLLASHEDYVLKIAFRVGDPFADLLHDDHSHFQPALGAGGPPPPAPAPVRRPWQIPDGERFGHGDYLPSDDIKWKKAADFMKRAFLGDPQPWPPG